MTDPKIDDTLFITPNSRLKDAIVKKVATEQMTNGITAIVTPNAMSLHDFITWCWGKLQQSNHPIACKNALLSSSGFFYKWVEIIRSDTDLETILHPTELANHAMNAYRRLKLWEISNFESDSLEADTFLKWKTQFEAQTKNFVTVEDATGIIVDALKSRHIQLPPNVCIFSFDDIPPLHIALFEVIKIQSNVVFDGFSLQGEKAASYIENRDDSEQLLNMARWAYNKHDTEPTARICIVVPELLSKRMDVLHALDEVFEPQVILPNTPRYVSPYNVSAGLPLSTQPIIRTALKLLNSGAMKQPIEEVLSLARSFFLGGSVAEADLRSQFDISVRNLGRKEMSLLDLIGVEFCPPKLSKFIGNFLTSLSKGGTTMIMPDWLTRFDTSLAEAGWPGERSLDSEEFQALKQFKDVLQDLCGTYSFSGAMDIHQALFYLNTTVNNSVYSPEGLDTPIQVMGLLEAAGQEFDYFYILDMNMGIVPAAASPNPLIPYQLQIDHKMPHADSNRELQFFETVLKRFELTSKAVLYSYCRLRNDAELMPSFFVKGNAEPLEHYQSQGINYKNQLLNQIPIKRVFDSPAPLKSTESVKGGVSIINKQAECPFKNFADNRLKSKAFPVIQSGLPSNIKGDLLHETLAMFWKKHRTQDALKAMKTPELISEISQFADKAFTAITRTVDIDFSLFVLEKELLMSTVMNWLKLESERPPFMVENIEETRQLDLGNMTISIRLDRVDAVKQGGSYMAKVPFDYKSGKSKSLLSKGKFQSFQLPIYALTEDEPHGMINAHINKSEAKMIGFTNGLDVGQSTFNSKRATVKTDDAFLDTIADCKKQIQLLAQSYIDGTISLTPSISACQYCDNNLICRTS